MQASTSIRTPKRRECEMCGRRERWKSTEESWVIAPEEAVGNPHCIHEWDINGTFSPYE